MTYDKRFYGLYEGICFDIDDPDNEYRIKLKVPQVLGMDITDWARACMPISSNPASEAHTSDEIAGLLSNHSATITSGSASSGTAHTHSVSINLSHSGNGGELNHQKVPAIGQKVWVMFIAGDPNFPVWIGVQP
jgi:hypothetical protein